MINQEYRGGAEVIVTLNLRVARLEQSLRLIAERSVEKCIREEAVAALAGDLRKRD